MNNRLLIMSCLVGIVMIELVTTAEIRRRRKMLVRRKLPIMNSLSQNRTSLPVRVVKKKIISSASPVLSSPLESLTEATTFAPQNRPFTVNETVPAKPDAVKRCKWSLV